VNLGRPIQSLGIELDNPQLALGSPFNRAQAVAVLVTIFDVIIHVNG
jgi:hypothetical protein